MTYDAAPAQAKPPRFSRRRTLSVLAAAAGLPLAISGLRALAPEPRFHTWKGEALGALSTLSLWHADEDLVQRTLVRVRGEIVRLEAAFSLFKPDSELSRLNRAGTLDSPSSAFVEVLEESRKIAALSGGAFDPTVQPLWDLHADHFRRTGGADHGPDARSIQAARDLVDHRNLDLGRRRVAFARPGMAATFNGIAQGYITDRIADMLRNEGFEHVVVELGEIRALGGHPDGRPWRIGIKDPRAPERIARTIDVAGQAVAVSGGYGTTFDAAGRNHHLFDPATGRSAMRMLDVTVIAPRATQADALSTAICVAGEGRAAAILAGYPGARALVTRLDGAVSSIGTA